MREARAEKKSSTKGLNRLPSTKSQTQKPNRKGEIRVKGEDGRVLVRKKIKHHIFALGMGLDLPLLILICILTAIGLVMLFSASYAYAFSNYGDSFMFIKKQGQFALIGIVVMLLISMYDYHQFHKLATLIYIVAVGLLLVVFFGGLLGIEWLVPNKNGATRWINLGFVEFQPSEVGKFAMVTMLADYISRKSEKILSSNTKGVLPCFGFFIGIAVLVVLEKHLSATIIITLLAFIIMYIGGIKLRWFVGIGALAVVGVACLVLFTDMFSHSLARIQGWLDPFNPPEGVDTWQTRQGLYAIGSGGILGVGLGQSKQKYLYLPEPQNDFIFAIVCEELGFIGAVIIILLFAMLIWRGVYISINAKDKFGTLLGLGITFIVGIQTVLNICVVTNAIPNTGISLPFFSYGGTSLLMLLGEMGILLSISRHSYVEKT